jgi:hypothetical protein
MELNEDVVLEDSEESNFKIGIIIDHDLNIKGNGHIIDACGFLKLERFKNDY